MHNDTGAEPPENAGGINGGGEHCSWDAINAVERRCLQDEYMRFGLARADGVLTDLSRSKIPL